MDEQESPRRSYLLAGTAACILIGGLLYFFAWDIISGIVPIIHKIDRVSVSDISSFTIPDGFSASVYADAVPGARVLARDPNGTLVVSLTSEGKVVALPDKDKDGKADSVISIVSNLTNPHGILFLCKTTSCELFVAESNALKRYSYDPGTHEATFKDILAEFPDDGGHYTRTLILSPNKTKILVSVGSSCNVCDEENPDRASILSIDLETGTKDLFARGLRNTVFMQYNPMTNELWGTDMGRDFLGDDLPPEEVNILQEGGNYGWPACFGKNVHDTNYDKKTYIRNPCMEPFETGSHIDLDAHAAPLGLAFLPSSWGEEYANDLLISLHGSWNSSVPKGYEVIRIPLDENGNVNGDIVDFMTGFIRKNEEVIGRPVDILVAQDSLFISDDKAGAIYRLQFQN